MYILSIYDILCLFKFFLTTKWLVIGILAFFCTFFFISSLFLYQKCQLTLWPDPPPLDGRLTLWPDPPLRRQLICGWPLDIYPLINLIILAFFTFYFFEIGWSVFELHEYSHLTYLILIIEFHAVEAFPSPCRPLFYSLPLFTHACKFFLNSLLDHFFVFLLIPNL